MRRWLLSLVILTSACGSADNQDAQDAGVPADAAPSERDASGREDAGAAAPDAALPIGPCEWGDEETLASGFGDNTNAQVAIDSQGNAIAVWQGTSLDEFDIQTRRYDVGTDTWGAEETLASGFGDNTNAQVAIDEQGNAIAVWQGTSLDEFDIQTRRYDVGTDTWGAEETLASGFGDNTNAQVAIDAQGNAIAVWQGASIDEFDIETRRYDAGTDTWGAEETLASGFGDNTNAQVAIDAHGNGIAVWQGTSLDEFDIQTRRYDLGADTWGAEETLASGFGDNTNTQVAIDAQGNAIAVWQGTSLDEFDIQTRRCRTP